MNKRAFPSGTSRREHDCGGSRRSILCTTLFAVAVALAATGCANVKLGKEKTETAPKRPVHWRAPESSEESDSPGGVLGALKTGFGSQIDAGDDPAGFYRTQFILWKKDHANLKRMLGRNSAGTAELALQVSGSLGGMMEMLDSEEMRSELAGYQARYERIAKKSTQGVAPTSFTLALDTMERNIKKRYEPGTPGLVYRPAQYFRDMEEAEFEED